MAKQTGTLPGLDSELGVSIANLRRCIEPLGIHPQSIHSQEMSQDSRSCANEEKRTPKIRTPGIEMGVKVQYSDWSTIDLVKCSEGWKSNAMIAT